MAEYLQLIASIEWLALGVVVLIRLKQWDKRFSELDDELREEMERWKSDG